MVEASAEKLKKVGPLCVDLSKKIGAGSFGKVYKGFLTSNESEIIAVKIISISPPVEDTEKLKKLIENELNILQNLKHENIVAFKIARATQHNVYISTEYCSGGELKKYMNKISTIQQVFSCLKQIVLGMSYANSLNIIHRDLKPENILLKDGKVKICDFGLGRFVQDPLVFAKMTEKKGNFLYMSPEVYEGKKYNSKCDVWAVGLIFYEMIYKTLPWYGDDEVEYFDDIRKKELVFLDEEDEEDEEEEFIAIDEDSKKLIRKMLEKDREKRISFNEILQDAALLKQEEIPELLVL